MKNKSLLFFAVLGVFLLCSCLKKIKCPAFSYPAFNEWLPYKAGDIVNYSNGTRNAVLKIYKSQQFGKKRDNKDGGFSGKPCERSYLIEGELKVDGISKPDTISYSARLIGLDNSVNVDGELMSYNSWGINFRDVTSASGFRNALSEADMANFAYLSRVEPRTFGNTTFEAVQTIVYKIAASRYDSIYIARQKGIVAFTLKGETSSFIIK